MYLCLGDVVLEATSPRQSRCLRQWQMQNIYGGSYCYVEMYFDNSLYISASSHMLANLTKGGFILNFCFLFHPIPIKSFKESIGGALSLVLNLKWHRVVQQSVNNYALTSKSIHPSAYFAMVVCLHHSSAHM